MSDNIDLKIHVDAATTGTDKLEAQRREFDKLEAELLSIAKAAKVASASFASLARGKVGFGAADDVKNGRVALDLDRARYGELKRILAFKSRMASQEKRENDDLARQFRAQEKAREQALLEQARTATRAAKDRAKAEADAERAIRDQIRETTRLRDRENRKAAQEADKARRAQDRAAQRAAQGASQAHSGASRVATGGAAAAAVMGYTGARAIRRGLSSRLETDTAETNLKIFSDTDDGKGGKRKITDADIKKLRRGPQGLDAEAIKNGVSISSAIDAYNEVAKAGLMDPMEQTRTLLSATTALELDPRATTKLMGTMARNMGKDATPARNKKVLNALAIGAREDPTQANEIVEGMNRAQPLLAMSKGFTEEDLVGLVSGGQSVGIQPGNAGTFLPAIAREILQGNDKFLSKGKRKEMNWAAKNLGYGSAKDLATQFAGPQGKQVYYNILEQLKTMPENLRAQVANTLAGGQWGDELLQHVNGLEGMKSTDAAINDPANANFLDEARNTKIKSWKGMWEQSQAIFSLFWESFGTGFDGILREINAFFLELHGKIDLDQISGYVKTALDGLKEGLGLNTWKEGLAAIFPSNIGGFGDKIRDFARGFGEGVRAIGSTLRTIGSAFGIGGGAEALGSVSAKFLLLSVACVALSPVIGILGGLASVILGLASVTRAAASVLGLGGAAAAGGLGGGAVAGALASVARLLSGGFILSLAGAIGNLRGEIVTLMIGAVKPLISALWEGLRSAFSLDGLKAGGSALLDELIPAPLKRWLDGDKATPTPGQGTGASTAWVDPPARTGTSEKPAPETPVEKLRAETDKQTQILQDQLRVQQEALQLEKTKDLADATKRSAGSAGAAVNDSMRQSPALSGSVGSNGPLLNSSTPGGSLRGVTGMNRNGIIGGDNASPDQKSGGSRSWRNNNPGNLEYGEFARANGATSSDGRFARFPTYEAGRKAQEKLLFESKGYKDLTLSQAIRRWAPASENNVPAYIAAMGGDPGKRMGEYTPDQRAKLLDAMQAHEGWKVGTVTGGGGGNVAASMPGGNPVDVARQYLGMGENNNRSAVEGFVGHNIRGAANAWCARFVGASLEAVGQRGTGSAIANSYLKYGTGIAAEMAAKGDILVEHRNKGAGATGGHVGFATGNKRIGRDGQLQLEMLSGNSSDQVQTTWENASKLAVRRAQQSVEQSQAIAKRAGSINLPNGAVGSAGSNPASAGLGAGDAATSAPTRGNGLGSSTPIRTAPVGSSGKGAGGGGPQVNAPITINGHNKDPQALAGEVQRHLQDSMNRRTHDYDGFA